jgi:hypothetical protein
MKIVKNIIMALVILIAALAVIGMMLPSAYKVSRSIVIQAPAEVAYNQVNDLKKMEAWSPWKQKDPTVAVTYGAVTEGKGASSSWTSKKMGEGSQTIVETVPSTSVKTALDFKGMGTATADFTFAPEGEGVKVTQTMTGDAGKNPFKHWMNLAMDKMIGPMFELGLNNLKTVSETRAAELKTEQAATQQAAATPADEAPTAAAPAAPAKTK